MNEGLKEILLKITEQLKNDGVDLEATPALFKWSYPDHPYLQFQLMIKEAEQSEISFDNSFHEDEAIVH